MKLIIGLGNIGAHYDGTRHNLGFFIVESFAARNNLDWTNKDRFKAHIAEGELHGQKIVLAKPTTFYNRSGEAARAIKDFYKLDNTDILVIHDEMDMPFGSLRVRVGGTDAGNNGIKGLIDHIGADFARIRTGIRVPDGERPTADAMDYVLGHFTNEENKRLGAIAKAADAIIEQFIDDNQKFEHTSVKIEE